MVVFALCYFVLFDVAWADIPLPYCDTHIGTQINLNQSNRMRTDIARFLKVEKRTSSS